MAAQSPTESTLQHFGAALSHLGWSLNAFGKPGRLTGRARGEGDADPVWTALLLPDGATAIVLSIGEALRDPVESFRAFGDLTAQHRAILAQLATARVSCQYLVLLDGQRAHLLDTKREDILVAAHSREEIADRILPLLDVGALARGSLASFPRKSLRQRAHELADWVRLWGTRLGGRLDLSQAIVARWFEWLILARVAELHGIGPRGDGSLAEFALTARAGDGRRLIESRFRRLSAEWFLLQEGSPKALLAIVNEAHESGLLDELLRGFSLLGAAKFDPEVLAEAFADEDLRVRSWRVSIAAEPLESDPPDEPTRWLTQELDVDLDSEGTMLLLRRLDELVEAVRRTSMGFESARERGERPGIQMDLLGDADVDLRPTEAPRHVLKRVLRVRTVHADRAHVARLVLLARGCEWYARCGAEEVPFPRVRVEVTREAVDVVAEPGPQASLN